MAEIRLDFSLPSPLPGSLPVLAMRRGVLLPGGVSPLMVQRPRSQAAVDAAQGALILVAVQREPVEEPVPADLLPTAVLARVIEVRPAKGGARAVVVQGIHRVQLTGFPSTHPYLEATFVPVREVWPDTPVADALMKTLRAECEETAKVLGVEAGATQFLRLPLPPWILVDAVAGMVEAPADWKREMLETADPLVRAEAVLLRLRHAREALDARRSIQERMDEDVQGLQKEALLRRQLKAIQSELGEGEEDEDLERLKTRLAEAALPAEVREVVDRELRRLERVNRQSPERSVAVDWLEWIADMPWGVNTAVDGSSEEEADAGATDRARRAADAITALESALDRTHFGLKDIKRQVVEHLAVRLMAGKGRADVLLLVGPPGVGKTSIGQAIADATGRKLLRVALGGMRDEAELRGHRRTYIGARPGRLVEGFRRAGAQDPVVLLDEIDKMGSGWQGDPASALLEVLDPEQNHAFIDRYLEVPFDLSRALFVATANDLSQVPAPLRDRMEVLDLAGYTRTEKVHIAREHLLERLARNAGVEPTDVVLSDEIIAEVIAGWTREAGVRQLQRALGRLYRAAAVQKARGELGEALVVGSGDLVPMLGRRRFHDEVHDTPTRAGVATGLAWTPVGGDVLYVEAATLPGKGQLVLTGQLGDVMKESARAALTYVLSHHQELDIDAAALSDHDVHIHVPAGAVPKDGPSAGVTMFTALASLLSGRPVRPEVAMTGEATLRGRVLPVGGIQAKVLAAHRMGLRTIILPRRNGEDALELPAEVREELNIVLVDDMAEVLRHALVPPTALAGDDEAAA
jgi:ATP-dependent Lon protease